MQITSNTKQLSQGSVVSLKRILQKHMQGKFVKRDVMLIPEARKVSDLFHNLTWYKSEEIRSKNRKVQGEMWTTPGPQFVHIHLAQSSWHYLGKGLWLYAEVTDLLKSRQSKAAYRLAERPNNEILIEHDYDWIALLDWDDFDSTLRKSVQH